MIYRVLGNTGLNLSVIGFGSWAISGSGYGPMIDSDSNELLHKALDRGINFIDTADSYGNGHSEELIGKVLEERNDKETVVATKFGWDFYDRSGIKGNLNSDFINQAVNESLRRLKKEVIDIYLIHSLNPRMITEHEVHNSLEKLRREGKIRYFGLSISDFYIKEYFSLLKAQHWDVIELTYNLLDREYKKPIFEFCQSKNIGIIVKEPLACGILTGKYSCLSKFPPNDHRNGWSTDYLAKRTNMADRIMKEFKLTNNELVRISLRYSLINESVTTAIPGMKNIEQLNENILSIDYSIDDNFVSWIEQN